MIGDLANLLGCTLGLKTSVTAITFVALGTSLPDTFASKSAAIGDNNADASIGNVTGSNSVNVFLGLGLPWLLASIYWARSVHPSPSSLALAWSWILFLTLIASMCRETRARLLSGGAKFRLRNRRCGRNSPLLDWIACEVNARLLLAQEVVDHHLFRGRII